MLQRVQTLFLIGVIILLGCFYFVPVATIVFSSGKIEGFILFHGAHLKGQDLHPVIVILLQIITWMLILLNLVTIFLFKRRKLQMSLCLISCLFLIILNVTGIFMIYHLKPVVVNLVHWQLPLFFPVLGAFFSYLAYKSIKKDEQLVRSYDRIR